MYVYIYIYIYIHIYFYLHKALVKTNLRLLNIETASIYLQVSVFKKMRHLKRFTINCYTNTPKHPFL